MVIENLLSYFPAPVYNCIEYSAQTIMKPAICLSSTVNLHTKENVIFAQPESVYVYTDIIKANLVGDSYVQLLTLLQFSSKQGYHIFDYPLYKTREESFMESV